METATLSARSSLKSWADSALLSCLNFVTAVHFRQYLRRLRSFVVVVSPQVYPQYARCQRCGTRFVYSHFGMSLGTDTLQETLRSIQAKSDAITRRSAGIPAAMSALLAAEPQAGGKLFPRAIKDLVAETLVAAQSTNIEESRLPQVHALNCIKEIFTTSKLSVASEAYIGQGLELAAKTLSSPM